MAREIGQASASLHICQHCVHQVQEDDGAGIVSRKRNGKSGKNDKIGKDDKSGKND